MLKTTTTALLAALAVPAASAASLSGSYGWEDGSATAFGSFGAAATFSNVSTGTELDYGPSAGPFVPPVPYVVTPQSGTQMLQISQSELVNDEGRSIRPDVVLAQIDGLVDGDTFSWSFQGFDPTDGRSPSIGGNAVYTTGGEPNSFLGFVAGFDEFGAGTGFLEAGFPEGQVFDAGVTPEGGAPRTGVALRARPFAPSLAQASAGGLGTYNFFLDNLVVNVETTSPTARIIFADGSVVAVPEPASLALLALGGTALLGRRRRVA